jgi:hypothetical protein
MSIHLAPLASVLSAICVGIDPCASSVLSAAWSTAHDHVPLMAHRHLLLHTPTLIPLDASGRAVKSGFSGKASLTIPVLNQQQHQKCFVAATAEMMRGLVGHAPGLFLLATLDL